MNLMIVHFAPGDMFLEEINRFVSKEMYYSRLPITRTFKGNQKKGGIIGSSSYREFEENSRQKRKKKFLLYIEYFYHI